MCKSDHTLTRRTLLKWSGITGASALIPGLTLPFDLPASAPTIPTGPRDESDLAAWTAVNPILYVEDDPHIVEGVKDIFEIVFGARVLAAGDGQTGLDLCRAEPVSLLMTGIEMPKLNGHELLAAVRADPALVDIPVMILSARGITQRRAFEAGAIAYITKPFDADDLLEETIPILLKHGRWTVIPEEAKQ